MDYEQNPRLEEWMLIIGDWYRNSAKIWFYVLLVVVVAAMPLYFVLSFFMTQALFNSMPTLRIVYQEVKKEPLQVVETKIFDLGNKTYSGYGRLKNPNTGYGIGNQSYRGDFKTSGGGLVASVPGETFVLPGTEKIIVFPRFNSDSAPTSLDFSLGESMFRAAPDLPTLTLEIQRKSVDFANNETLVNAVILNRTPFKISRVDLPVLLFNNTGQVIGVNYTNINDLDASESRSFQYVWYNRINNVARIEIIPELNIFNPEIFIAEPGKNPFENLD